MNVEFDVVRGTGPIIPQPLRTAADVAALTPIDDFDAKLPFIRTILGDLRKETEGGCTLIGFVGSPFTLVSYAVEGQANRHCINTKKMMTQAPEVLHAALDHFATEIGKYGCHQIECGAQTVQFFESWAHHIGAGQFEEFAKPYANKAMAYIKERHPDVPVIYYANGGSPYLESQRDMSADMITLDWATDMKTRGSGWARISWCRATWTRLCSSAHRRSSRRLFTRTSVTLAARASTCSTSATACFRARRRRAWLLSSTLRSRSRRER